MDAVAQGFAVYAGRVRLGTVERIWPGGGDPPTIVAVKSLFPGVPPLLVRLSAGVEISNSERRVQVGNEPELVFQILSANGLHQVDSGRHLHRNAETPSPRRTSR